MIRSLFCYGGFFGAVLVLTGCLENQPPPTVDLFPNVHAAEVYEAVRAASEINRELIKMIGEEGLPNAPFVRELLVKQQGELLKGGLPCQTVGNFPGMRNASGLAGRGKRPPNPCPKERETGSLPLVVPTGAFTLAVPGKEYDVVIRKGNTELGRTGQPVAGVSIGVVKQFGAKDFSAMRGEVTVEVLENGKVVRTTDMYLLTSAEVRQ